MDLRINDINIRLGDLNSTCLNVANDYLESID